MSFGQRQKQSHIRRLSEIKPKEKIAFCPKCEEFFIDDVSIMGSYQCPNDGCGRPLVRGMDMKDGVVYDVMGRKFRSLK